MKKLLLVTLFTIFLSQSSYGADAFLNNFQNYRHAIRQALGMDTASAAIDDTTLNQFIREAVLFINPVVKFRQKEFTFATTYRNSKYALDTLIAGLISVEWFNLDSTKTLFYAPRNTWYNLPTKLTSAGTDSYSRRPSWYDNTDSLIFLYPPPVIVGDSIRILAWTKLPNWVSKDTVDIIPLLYREAVEANAIYRAARSRQHPLIQLFRGDYIESLNILREAYGRKTEKTTATPSNP